MKFKEFGTPEFDHGLEIELPVGAVLLVATDKRSFVIRAVAAPKTAQTPTEHCKRKRSKRVLCNPNKAGQALGAMIRAERERRGMTHQQFGKLTGYSPKRLTIFERAVPSITPRLTEVLQKLNIKAPKGVRVSNQSGYRKA